MSRAAPGTPGRGDRGGTRGWGDARGWGPWRGGTGGDPGSGTRLGRAAPSPCPRLSPRSHRCPFRSLPGLSPVPVPLSPRCPSRSTRGRYGEGAKQEKFKYALTLVFIQCVINAAFAKLRKSGIPGAAVAEPGAAAEPPLSPQ